MLKLSCKQFIKKVKFLFLFAKKIQMEKFHKSGHFLVKKKNTFILINVVTCASRKEIHHS